jgi:hypothetical protein
VTLAIPVLALAVLMGAAPASPRRRRPTVEAPHVEMTLDPKRVAQGEEITVTGRLRGYELAGSDFCLQPRWDVFARSASGGLLQLKVIPPDPMQCRDHEFRHTFRFALAGDYVVRLELRTTGTRVRLQDWGFSHIDVGDAGGTQ